MVDINRMIENRKYSNPNFYSTFKRKITLAFELERRIEENKFSKETIKQARRQYLVYLVSCLESYLEELFKRYIDFELVDFQKLLKMRRLKQIRFDLYDLFDFNKNNIRLSEIIIAYLNFQNINCILDLCDVIEFDKYVSKLKKSLENNFKKEKNFLVLEKFVKTVSRQTNQTLDNLIVSKATSKMIIEYMASDYMLLELFSAQKCINTLTQLITKRHKIVHKAADIDIKNWEVLAYTLAVIQFSSVLFKMYNFRKSSLK